MRPTTTNKVLLIGYVSADPEKLELKNGGVGAKFRMATYQSYTELDSAAEVKMEFHRIVGFGDAAKAILRIVKKGHVVEVDGRLSTRSYVDRNGVKRTSTSIVATSVLQHELSANDDPEVFGSTSPQRAAK